MTGFQTKKSVTGKRAKAAERKAGDMLKDMERSEGGRPRENSSNVGHVSDYSETLDNADITRQEANRWQTEAELSEDEFHRPRAQGDNGTSNTQVSNTCPPSTRAGR